MNSERVIDAVLAVWNKRFEDYVTPAMVKSRTRLMNVATCRQICIYVLRKMTQRSTISIGKVFGRDHSTVVHSCSVIQYRVDKGMVEASIIHDALMILKDVTGEQTKEEIEADNSVIALYHKERRRADGLEVELMGARSKLHDLQKIQARLRAEVSRLRQMVDSDDYVKPMEWTAKEREQLRKARENGIPTHSIG